MPGAPSFSSCRESRRSRRRVVLVAILREEDTPPGIRGREGGRRGAEIRQGETDSEIRGSKSRSVLRGDPKSRASGETSQARFRVMHSGRRALRVSDAFRMYQLTLAGSRRHWPLSSLLGEKKKKSRHTIHRDSLCCEATLQARRRYLRFSFSLFAENLASEGH